MRQARRADLSPAPPGTEPLVMCLDDPRARNPNAVGGKAASLATLRWLRLPTPDSCCLTAHAYLRHLRDGGLLEREAALRRRLPDEDVRCQLQEMVATSDIQETLQLELDEHLAPFGDVRLAVRSSALGEDAEALSFAGQHETLLGVEQSQLGHAICSCWASLWSARAGAYRGRDEL